MWTNGPFPAGSWSDNRIFQHKLLGMLGPEEMVECDGTYIGMPFDCRLPNDYLSDADKQAKAKARARHEVIHRRLKEFGCLGKQFQHSLERHKTFFRCCVVLVQLAIEFGEEVAFHVDY